MSPRNSTYSWRPSTMMLLRRRGRSSWERSGKVNSPWKWGMKRLLHWRYYVRCKVCLGSTFRSRSAASERQPATNNLAFFRLFLLISHRLSRLLHLPLNYRCMRTNHGFFCLPLFLTSLSLDYRSPPATTALTFLPLFCLFFFYLGQRRSTLVATTRRPLEYYF